MTRFVPVVVVVATLVAGSAMAQSKAGASRVDFDDQLVQGQVNKGAVHLIERKEANLGSLVKKRTSYRKEILAGTDVLEAKAPTQSAVAALPLPVVKAVDLKGEAIEPIPAKPAVAPAKAPIPAPAKPAANVNSKSKGPAKKPAVKSNESKQSKKTNGGSRVISRR